MKALVTGASGNVGSALLRSLSDGAGWQVRVAVRTIPPLPVADCEYVAVGDLAAAAADVSGLASGCDVVVHAAARVHVMHEDSSDADVYRQVNVGGTLRVAREALRSGVRRFVFISSVKVNGERTAAGHPFVEADAPDPQGPYAASKWQAERGLQELCAGSRMECVIIRPPLVYGPGVRANFLALAAAVRRRVPLPLGAVRNRRSLVAMDNLVDFVRVCMQHPAAANQTFLVSDGHDLSTPELIRGMAAAMNRPACLVPLPVWMLRTAGMLTGQQLTVQRLLENMQVDIGKARRQLGWAPPITVEEGLRRALQPLRRE
jgi:nucleoside-diphosphate-sugar epimerase